MSQHYPGPQYPRQPQQGMPPAAPPHQPPPAPYQQWPMPPMPHQPPVKRSHWYTSRWAIGIAAGIVGIIIGSSSTGAGEDNAISHPTTTVTATATATSTVTANGKSTARRSEPDRQKPKAPNQISFTKGTFVVGDDIKAGTYRSTGGDNCYWARLKNLDGSLSSIIASDWAPDGGPQVVNVKTADAAFKTSDCGTWTKIS